MTRNIMFSMNHTSFSRRPFEKIIAILILLLSVGFTPSFATLVTHQWQESHRGYSIELVPGTTGATARYVAAGTIYDPVNYPGLTGWHFMHLDASGNVLNSRMTWKPNSQFRVVDIVAQTNNAFRIIIQAIDKTSSPIDNYIYIHGVTATGADLPAANNPTIRLSNSIAGAYKALYPTHGYWASNGFLYLVGYATPNGISDPKDGGGPLKYTSDKISWIIRVGVNGTISLLRYSWNTSQEPNGTDYDMALRISPYSPTNDFPLLVTGAINNGDGGSAAYIGKFNPTLAPLAQNGVLFSYPNPIAIVGTNRWGFYAVDARGDIGATDDIVLLINSFDEMFEDNPNTGCIGCPGRTWGIARIKDDLTVYGPSIKSLRMKNVASSDSRLKVNEWATQFLELHYNINEEGDHIYVVGQKFEPLNTACAALPAGSLAPGKLNVNPFVSGADLNSTFLLSGGGSGYTPLPGSISGAKTYLSSKGTNTANLDYFNGSLSLGSALEDASRLYTFASVERYYNDPTDPSQPHGTLSIVAPVGEKPPAANPNLLTRFIGIDPATYDELVCQKVRQDCSNVHVNAAQNKGVINPLSFTIFSSAVSGLVTSNFLPPITPCASGYYKPTGITEAAEAGVMEIYPNPASTELNIKLSEALTAKDIFTFVLTDMTGRTMYTYNKAKAGQSAISVSLPQLMPGIYFGIVHLNGQRYSKKITIK